MRDRNNFARSGITPAMFTALLNIQERKCGICGRPLDLGNGYRIHRDHCHKSLEPRGLLCPICNQLEGAIAKTGLTPEDFAARLAEYTRNPPARIAELVVEAPPDGWTRSVQGAHA